MVLSIRLSMVWEMNNLCSGPDNAIFVLLGQKFPGTDPLAWLFRRENQPVVHNFSKQDKCH